MQRAVKYCRWLARWWEEQAVLRTDVSPALREGLVAYARKQAAAETKLGEKWEAKFKPVRIRAEQFLRTTYLSDIDKLAGAENQEAVMGAPTTAFDESSGQALDELVELSLEDPEDSFMEDEFE